MEQRKQEDSDPKTQHLRVKASQPDGELAQREPWEQQGVRSGSEASLKPVPYKLDQPGITLSASPCVRLANGSGFRVQA